MWLGGGTNTAEKLPIQLVRSITQHFRHLTINGHPVILEISRMTFLVPRKILIPTIPQIPQMPDFQKIDRAWGRLWRRLLCLRDA